MNRMLFCQLCQKIRGHDKTSRNSLHRCRVVRFIQNCDTCPLYFDRFSPRIELDRRLQVQRLGRHGFYTFIESIVNRA